MLKWKFGSLIWSSTEFRTIAERRSVDVGAQLHLTCQHEKSKQDLAKTILQTCGNALVWQRLDLFTALQAKASALSSPVVIWVHHWQSPLVLDLPVLIKEFCSYYLAWPERIWRCSQINNRPVRQLRDLTCVVQVSVFPISEATIEYHVSAWIRWIGINHCRNMMSGTKFSPTDSDLLVCPLQR